MIIENKYGIVDFDMAFGTYDGGVV